MMIYLLNMQIFIASPMFFVWRESPGQGENTHPIPKACSYCPQYYVNFNISGSIYYQYQYQYHQYHQYQHQWQYLCIELPSGKLT